MRKRCGLARHRSNGHCKVRSLNHRVKCDYSVQRIVTFTKQNFVIFSKMCVTFFHNWSLSQVTAWIYSSERWKKFRRSLEILCLQVYKKVLGAISRFMRPKMKLLLLSSDAMWKFSPDEDYGKNFGRIFTTYVYRTEAVSCEVQTHFGGFHLARYITKVLGALSRFLRPQTKLFAMKFRRILEVFSV